MAQSDSRHHICNLGRCFRKFTVRLKTIYSNFIRLLIDIDLNLSSDVKLLSVFGKDLNYLLVFGR